MKKWSYTLRNVLEEIAMTRGLPTGSYSGYICVVALAFSFALPLVPGNPGEEKEMRAQSDDANTRTVGPERGWLVIHGGGSVTNEVRERFVALAGGPDANVVLIPTALTDNEIEKRYGRPVSDLFGAKHITV